MGSASSQHEGTSMSADYDGNVSQNRVIAKQLFDVWSAEHQKGRSRFNASLPAWLACALSLSTLIWGAGSLSSDVAENRRRIDVLEAAHLQQNRDDQVVRDRLARIEAKVDLLIEGAQ